MNGRLEQILFHYFVFCKQKLTLFQKLYALKVMLVYKASIVTGQCFFSLGNLLRDLEELLDL